MKGIIYITGEIGVDTTLNDVVQQVKSQSNATEYLVKIDSVGGYVDSGDDIYNYLVNLGKPVSTFTTKAYSIASKIFMAGTTRIIPENATDAIMIHLPWMEVQGTHQVISNYLKDLKAIEDELVDFYSKVTEIDEKTIHSLLSSETYLDATQAFDWGFATQLQPAQLAVAKLKNNIEEKEESLMDKLNQKIDSIMNMLTGKKPEIKAELVLQDGTSVSITFPELSESDAPAVDDKAMVDGQPAEGEYTMPDGTVFKFEKGVLTEIVPPVQEDQTQEDSTNPVDVENENKEPQTKAEVIKEIMKWEIDVVSTSFEVGDSVMYEYEGIQYTVGAGEYEIPSTGKKVITDANGVIVQVMDGSTEPMTQEPAAVEAENNESKMVELIEILAKKNEELETKYLALAKQVGSDLTIQVTEPISSIQKENIEGVKAFSIKRRK